MDFNCDSVEMTVVNSWGYDAWSGMLGYLHRGDADIGASPMFVIEERLSMVTYIAGTTRSRQVRTDAIREAGNYPTSHLVKKS